MRYDPSGIPIFEGNGYASCAPLRHEQPGMDEYKPSDRDVLRQIGWFRTDTQFMSLNLSPEQFDVMQKASAAMGGTAEEMVTEALRFWLSNSAEART